MENTSLQFLGDLNPWFGLFLAFGLAYLAFRLYRRETRERKDRLRWGLPLLRAGAIFLAVLALTGPILHHERVIRELGKLFVFVDGSKSMSITDETMPPERKVAVMQAMGMLPRDKAHREAADAAAHLARARFIAEGAIDAGPESAELKESVGEFSKDIVLAFEAFEDFTGRLEKFGGAPGLLLSQRYRNDPRFFDRSFRSRPDEHPAVRQTRYLDGFRYPQTTDTDFTLWVRGYLNVPEDGRYRFWISSDDSSQLWLSRDESPSNIEMIARVDGYTPELSFDEGGSQRSREFQLEKGQRYYIEAVLDGGVGENHLSVAWQRSGADGREEPIPGKYFTPWTEGVNSGGGDHLQQFRERLLAGAKSLNEEVRDGGDPFAHIEKLGELNDTAIVLQERLREYVLSSASAIYAANRDDEAFQEKLAEFDKMDRKARVERLLLAEEDGVLAQLAEQQDIEFVALRGGEADSLWWQRRGGKKQAGPLPYEIRLSEAGDRTDIGEAIKETIGDAEKGVGVLVFSDGQHNVGSSPIAAAKVLGEQGIPMFTVGTGTLQPPEDMALIDVVGPETVFSKDRVKGTITVLDTMRSRSEYEVKIQRGDEIVWRELFDSDGSREREFEYDFPVEELVKQFQADSGGDDIEYRSVPLNFEVSVAPTAGPDSGGEAGEVVAGHLEANDKKPLSVQAIAQPRKILLIDARPRWETRYLHNMFSRDEQWEVNALMEVFTSTDVGRSWERGEDEGTFPATREELFKYESIFIGDVPRFLFSEEELEWLAEFVENRGGGIVFIDGQRDHLREYADTELGELLPVEWLEAAGDGGPESPAEMPSGMVLASAGAEFAPLRFAGTGAENDEIWGRLRPPHWGASVRALPGTEVLAHLEYAADGDEGTGRRSPLLVSRRSGAGKVLYSASDELWRWRYNVADRYHQKFWVQLANWVGEKPFSVAGSRASIGADKLVYEPGETAALRVRLRDDRGDPVDEGDYVAVLYDAEGKVAAEIELEVDANGGGMFRGRSGELASGEYEIAIRQKYFLKNPEEFDARAQLVVKGAADRELDDLALDAELMKNIARSSGGQFFHEEETQNLVNLLESIDRKKVIPSQTVLWSSYWWFALIIGLLTAEWILRKKSGYV